MALEPKRTYSKFEDDAVITRESVYMARISSTISFKKPNFEKTLADWQPAKKSHKTFRQRCTKWENGGFCMTNIGIITLSAAFCLCIPPNLSSHEEKENFENWSLSIFGTIIFTGALTLSSLSLLFLWLTHLTDPGVIPRENQIEIRMLKEGERNCETCNIIKPPRAKHCRYCDHCVKVFDHHCPYAGVCVGNGNYLFFFLLLFSGLISMIYVFIFSLWFVLDDWLIPGKMRDGLCVQLMLGVFLTIFSCLIVVLVGQLSAYHIFIAAKGQTTNERVLTKRKEKALKTSEGTNLCGSSKIETVWKEPLLVRQNSRESQLGRQNSNKSGSADVSYFVLSPDLNDKEVQESKIPFRFDKEVQDGKRPYRIFSSGGDRFVDL